MVDLASLVVRLVADTSRFRDNMDRAVGDLNKFASVAKKALAAVAGFASIRGALSLAQDAIDSAAALNDLSKSLGISTEALSELQYVAEQSGSNLEGLTTGLKKLGTQAVEASQKAGGARDAFRLIGVSVTDAAGKLKPTEQLLLDVSEKFAMYKDGAAKAAAAQDIFGKSGADLIPFLNNGRAGIEQLRAEAARLGLTIGTDTAQAANDFNSSVDRLKKSFTGVVNGIVTKMLPALMSLVTRFEELVKEGNGVNYFLEGLGNVFKFVTAGATRLYYFISNLGRQLGALAAIIASVFKQLDITKLLNPITAPFEAAKQLIKLNLTEAKEILKQNLADQAAAEEAMNKTLEAIYGKRVEIMNPDPAPSDKKPGSDKVDFPTLAKEAGDGIEEIEIRLKKIELPEDIYADMRANTQTALEKAFQEFRKRMADLQVLKLEGQDLENYDARKKAIEEDFEESINRLKKPVEEINEFTKQAAANTQDIIANTFESIVTGADISAKSILQSFGQMIIKLAAQAAAANLAGKLFGEAAGGTKGSTGWIGAAIAAFGGTRDSGGRGQRGMAYMIGTGAQPEMFVPDSAGTFVPAGAGRASVTNNFTLVAEGPVSKRTQLQIGAAAARGVERASRRNN